MSGFIAFAKTAFHLTTHISMRLRLTALVLSVTLLVLIATTIFINRMAGSLIEHSPQEQMKAANNTLKASVTVWLENHHSALSYLVSLPGIVSMQAKQQKPLLEKMAAAYPHMYLVSIVNLNGINSARNDNEILTDYKSRLWFRKVRRGAQIVFDSIIGKTSGKPALVVSMPVKDRDGFLIGVAMFATDLHQLSLQVQSTRVGVSGFAYLVDPDNRVVAHPDPQFSLELRDFSNYPPVNRARSGQLGEMRFSDQDGTDWVSYTSALGNGWLGVVQINESEFSARQNLFQHMVTGSIFATVLVLMLTIWWALRNGLNPIEQFTSGASATAIPSVESYATVTALPTELTKRLHHAIVTTDQEVIFELCDELAKHDTALATLAGKMAQNYDYKGLQKLLETERPPNATH